MTPEHEVHHSHAHRTGHRLLDLAVPVSALLQFATGNANDKGENEITMKIENAGVGPAKLISLEIFQGERRIRTPLDLINALDPAAPRPSMQLGITLPTVLRAGTDTLIVGMKRAGNEALWDTFTYLGTPKP